MSFLNRFLEEKPKDDTLRSIVRNLTHLLNSKRGYGSRLCAFGLGSMYEQQGSGPVVESVLRDVLSDVRTYEPRLRAIELRVLGDGELPIAFELCAEARIEEGRALVPRTKTVPCRLAILFDPISTEIAIRVLESEDAA